MPIAPMASSWSRSWEHPDARVAARGIRKRCVRISGHGRARASSRPDAVGTRRLAAPPSACRSFGCGVLFGARRCRVNGGQALCSVAALGVPPHGELRHALNVVPAVAGFDRGHALPGVLQGPVDYRFVFHRPRSRMRCGGQLILRMVMKASCGMSTEPICFMRFLPSFCFSRSLRLRVMSPP